MKFDITYGAERLSFGVNDPFLTKDLPFISPRKIAVTKEMADIEGAIKKALADPVNSPLLRDIVKGKKVALVVSDEFRAGQQEKIIKCLIEEISKGNPGFLTVICATGSHEPDVYAKNIKIWAEKYASSLKQNFKFVANNCDSKGFINIGKCSDGTPIDLSPELLKCEVRVYGHESKHHYMNGYSCIDKQVLPGVSSRRAIEGNHKNALQHEFAVAGNNVWVVDEKRRKNPFSLGSSEARIRSEAVILTEDGKIIEKKATVFGLDMISDKKAVYWARAGEVGPITTEMIKEADRLSAFVAGPVRYVVISPGGPPASQAIYGVQNCFDMALSGAIEDGGEALVVAPCDGRPDIPQNVRGLAPDLKSKELFWDNLARLKDKPLKQATDWIRDNFELYLWKTDRVIKLMNGRKVKIYLYSCLPDYVIARGGFIPCHNIEEWIKEREGRNDGALRVIDDGNKILVITKK